MQFDQFNMEPLALQVFRGLVSNLSAGIAFSVNPPCGLESVAIQSVAETERVIRGHGHRTGFRVTAFEGTNAEGIGCHQAVGPGMPPGRMAWVVRVIGEEDAHQSTVQRTLDRHRRRPFSPGRSIGGALCILEASASTRSTIDLQRWCKPDREEPFLGVSEGDRSSGGGQRDVELDMTGSIGGTEGHQATLDQDDIITDPPFCMPLDDRRIIVGGQHSLRDEMDPCIRVVPEIMPVDIAMSEPE